MAVESLNINLNTTMPDFTLNDAGGHPFSIDDLMGQKGLLIYFTCNHCPYAKAVWPRSIKLATYAKAYGINAVAINPNINPNYPEDAPDVMLEKVKEWAIPFPYLVDEMQAVAKAYQAQCTPDIYLLDHNKTLIYHGRIDDNWQDESKVSREDLKAAIDAFTSGNTVANTQYPSMGCSIKWVS